MDIKDHPGNRLCKSWISGMLFCMYV